MGDDEMVAVNLVPPSVLRVRTWRRHAQAWALAIAVGLVLVGVLAFADWTRRGQAATLQAQYDELQVELTTKRAHLRVVSSKATRGRVRLKRAEALRAKRAWSAMFSLIERCMPPGCWLTSVATDPAVSPSAGGSNARVRRVSIKGSEIATVAIEAPRKLRIVGFAADAAEPHVFVASLKSAAVFQRVTLQRSRMETASDGSYFSFELLCEW